MGASTRSARGLPHSATSGEPCPGHRRARASPAASCPKPKTKQRRLAGPRRPPGPRSSSVSSFQVRATSRIRSLAPSPGLRIRRDVYPDVATRGREMQAIVCSLWSGLDPGLVAVPEARSPGCCTTGHVPDEQPIVIVDPASQVVANLRRSPVGANDPHRIERVDDVALAIRLDPADEPRIVFRVLIAAAQIGWIYRVVGMPAAAVCRRRRFESGGSEERAPAQ
jgi:hypothetical protein